MKVSATSAAYCERDGDDFNLLGEPCNFFSNFVQILVGIIYCVRVSKQKNFDVNLPGGIIYTLVAVGSAIWHSVGLQWALYLDLGIPFIFISWFMYNWAYRQLGIRSVPKRFGAMICGLGIIGSLSTFYTSPLIGVHWGWFTVLVMGGFVHFYVSTWHRWRILQASAFYAIGLFFFAADRELCKDEQDGYQPGFHWLWHLFSATGGLILLYSLPPEDWFIEGHDIQDIWCGCFKESAVQRREGLDANVVQPKKVEEALDIERGGAKVLPIG